MEITVRDLMNQSPAMISVDASLDDAVVAMMQAEVNELYVVDDDRQLLGVIPDYELLKLYLNGLSSEQTLVGITSSNITTIQPGYSIMQVSPLFRNSYLDRLAVVDGGRLVGALNRRDVIWLLSTVDRVLHGERNFAKDAGVAYESPADERTPVATPKFLRQQRTRTNSEVR